MLKAIVIGFFVVAMSSQPGCESCDQYSPTKPSSVSSTEKGSSELSNIKEAVGDIFGNTSSGLEIPKTINGVELLTIKGWLANIYPWEYVPEQSTVHPASRLWTQRQLPSPFQMAEQCRQIKEFGGGAAVLEYNPNPIAPDHNYWLSTGFANGCGPFFLLYEHINGTRYSCPNNCSKDMNNPQNRQVFKDDIDFMFRNVIVPNQSRYVTVNGRAVIYMWASSQMIGDFAGLLEEVKKEYPVFFIGSGGEIWANPKGEDLARVKALDGFMEYSLGGRRDYLRVVQDYNRTSSSWRGYLRSLEVETGKRHVFIPTFQAAYDDTKVIPKRNNPPMYARSRDEVKYHAEMIRSGMGSVYDSTGPFVIYSELPEGAAVIESQCLPATIDKLGRFYGCGTRRLEILKEYFGW
ncbi:MAG: hypothetical protein AAB857_00675 [Patescibacteria group bacterium]